jgi:putative lipoic acid-binding regulatory protein
MSIEREVYDFPTRIPLKIIGRNESEFESFVLSLFHLHVEPAEIHAVNGRLSRNDAYLSVTVTFTAQSREQLDALYGTLNSHPRVLMVI